MNKHEMNYPSWICPKPLESYPNIVMGHGSGGKMMADLIEHIFSSAFNNDLLNQMGDSTVINLSTLPGDYGHERFAYTTDSYVVNPLFFPGGNIGDLSINGTVNDLAMHGAKPLLLSAGFILEEGLSLETLGMIANSMAVACDKADVKIVTGDTKVVQKGHGDGIFINTSGLGFIPEDCDIAPENAVPGDFVIVNGTIGDHGMAIMSVREGLSFRSDIKSDTAPLYSLVAEMLKASTGIHGPKIHCLRDATRGGLAAVLNEIARASKVGIEFDELGVPVRPPVKAACEMLGLDPFYIANEGKLAAILPQESVEPVLEAMQQHQYGKDSAIIGRVVSEHPGLVTAKTSIGGQRIINYPTGELLPRIC